VALLGSGGADSGMQEMCDAGGMEAAIVDADRVRRNCTRVIKCWTKPQTR
jgi:hypothetical protein